MCNVVAEVQRLTEPIRSVKGNLGIWKLKEVDRMELGRRLRADGATELTGFERILTRPTEAQLRELKRRQRDEAEYARGVKRARKAQRRARGRRFSPPPPPPPPPPSPPCAQGASTSSTSSTTACPTSSKTLVASRAALQVDGTSRALSLSRALQRCGLTPRVP